MKPHLLTESTERLLGQLDRSAASIDSMVTPERTRSEIVTDIVSAVADSYTDATTLGETAEFLSIWHGILANRCSDRFKDLQSQLPTLPREVLRTDPQLIHINAVRKGVRRARNHTYNRLNRPSPRHSLAIR